SVGERVSGFLRHAPVLVLGDPAPRAVMTEADGHWLRLLPVRRTRVRQRPPPDGGICVSLLCGGGRAEGTALHRWAPEASGLDSVSCSRERRRRPGPASCNMLKRGRPPWSGAFLVCSAASDGSRNPLGLAYSLGRSEEHTSELQSREK